MNNLMIDLEALGTGHNGLITQIGGCYFDWSGEIGDTFLYNINLKSAVAVGMTLDIGAVLFWISQVAINGSPSWITDSVPLQQVLNDLVKIFKQTDSIWSHTFDRVLLRDAGNLCGMPNLIPHKKWREINTLVALAGTTKIKTKHLKTHNALDDCLYQIEYCVACYRSLHDNNKK